MVTFNKFLKTFDENPQIKGKQFEHFVKWFLKNDPQWKTQVDKVWLWDDWPDRWSPRTKHALPAWEVTLRKLADVRELRVDHLRAARIRHLSQQHIRLRARHSILFLEPIDHLFEGDAEGVVKRAGAAHGANVCRRLDARPSQPTGRRRK